MPPASLTDHSARYPTQNESKHLLIDRKLSAVETSDLHFSTLNALDPKRVDVLVLYSRTWEPGWGVLQWAPARDFLQRFYEYEPQMTPAQVREHF